MDSPLSWFILVCITICFDVWFAKRALDELEGRNNHEWDDEW